MIIVLVLIIWLDVVITCNSSIAPNAPSNVDFNGASSRNTHSNNNNNSIIIGFTESNDGGSELKTFKFIIIQLSIQVQMFQIGNFFVKQIQFLNIQYLIVVLFVIEQIIIVVLLMN